METGEMLDFWPGTSDFKKKTARKAAFSGFFDAESTVSGQNRLCFGVFKQALGYGPARSDSHAAQAAFVEMLIKKDRGPLGAPVLLLPLGRFF